MNKFIYEVQQESHSSIGSATALLQGKRGYSRLCCGILTRFAINFFFPTSRLTQERVNFITNKLPTRRVQDLPLSFFVLQVSQFKESKGFFANKLHTRALEVRESQGSHWVRQGWSIATRREHDKVEKRKEKDQGRGEGGSSEGNVPCVLNQEFLFFGSQVLVFRSDPSRMKYWLLRDLVYKEAMCEGSTGNGLLNAVKAAP